MSKKASFVKNEVKYLEYLMQGGDKVSAYFLQTGEAVL